MHPYVCSLPAQTNVFAQTEANLVVHTCRSSWERHALGDWAWITLHRAKKQSFKNLCHVEPLSSCNLADAWSWSPGDLAQSPAIAALPGVCARGIRVPCEQPCQNLCHLSCCYHGRCSGTNAQWRIQRGREKNMFGCRKNQMLPLRCGSRNASPAVVHRPRSWSLLHFDIRNI